MKSLEILEKTYENLKNKFPDFKKEYSEINIRNLNFNDPEIREKIGKFAFKWKEEMKKEIIKIKNS